MDKISDERIERITTRHSDECHCDELHVALAREVQYYRTLEARCSIAGFSLEELTSEEEACAAFQVLRDFEARCKKIGFTLEEVILRFEQNSYDTPKEEK